MQIPSFSVTLTMQEWQVVLGALGEMPFRVVQPVIGKIVGQVEGAQRNTTVEAAEEK